MARRCRRRTSLSSAALTIVSYNIHRCVGRDGAARPERILEVLRALDADVIALQEIDCPKHGLDQLRFLAQALDMSAWHGETLRDHLGSYGNGLLTRRSVRRVYDIALCDGGGREPRCAIDAELELTAGAVRVIATHLGLGLGERRRQIRKLRHLIARQVTQPVIVAGDLNEWVPWGGSLTQLRAHFRLPDGPKTFPARRPLWALDRILVHPSHAQPVVTVADTPLARVASDHLPVVARVDVDLLFARTLTSQAGDDSAALG